MPGYSYSGIKSIDRGGTQYAESEKMRLGTLVHTYLLRPALYDHTNERHNIVKKLAVELKAIVGTLLTTMRPELAVLANFCYNDFVMPYKGCIDLSLFETLVIDFKITELSLDDGVSRFGYDSQLTGYGLATKTDNLFLIGVHPRTLKTRVKMLAPNYEFWQQQILRKGNVIKQ